MNKKQLVFALLAVVVILTLAACSALNLLGAGSSAGQSAAANPDGSAAQSPGRQNQPPDMANQPIEQKLAIGTLKLEGTDQAITAEQAKALLPLWKAVKSMSSDSSASIEEINALYEQIQESMTPEQVQAIQDLKLTGEDMQTLMQQYNVQMPQGGPGNLSEEERATRVAEFRAQGGGQGGGQGGFAGGRQGGPPDGEMGVLPPDMAGAAAGEQPNAQGSMQSTPRAGRRGFGGGMNTIFVDPLIKVLEQRAGE